MRPKNFYKLFETAYNKEYNEIIKIKKKDLDPKQRRAKSEKRQLLVEQYEADYLELTALVKEDKTGWFNIPYLDLLIGHVKNVLDQDEYFENDFNKFIDLEYDKFRMRLLDYCTNVHKDVRGLQALGKEWTDKEKEQIAPDLGKIFGILYGKQALYAEPGEEETFLFKKKRKEYTTTVKGYLPRLIYALKYNISKETLDRYRKQGRVFEKTIKRSIYIKDQPPKDKKEIKNR